MAVTCRAAVIGCGKVSYAHLWGYASLGPMVELVAAADVDRSLLERRGREFRIAQLYGNYRRMIEEQQPDVVSICTTAPSHREMVNWIAKSGVRGILCEKPMALSVTDAAAMVKVCEEHSVCLALGHQMRSQLYNRQARVLIEQGAIGEPVFSRVICDGPLFTVGIHTLDVLRFLVGDIPIAWVLGQAELDDETSTPGFTADTTAIGYVRFRNGFTALFEGGEAAAPRLHFVSIEGAEGVLETRFFGEPKARFRSQGETEWTPIGPLPEAGIPPLPPDTPAMPVQAVWDRDPPDEVYPFRLEMLDLIQSIEEGRQPRASGVQGLASFEACMALYESSRRGGVVRLPLER